MVSAELFGVLGALIILLAFILNLVHALNTRARSYLLLNLFGSIILCYYAYLLSSLPFLILNSVWAAASLIKMVHVEEKRKLSKRKKRL